MVVAYATLFRSGDGVGLGADRRGGLVDVDAGHGSAGAVAGQVGDGEGVALAGAFRGEGERIIGRGQQAGQAVAGTVAAGDVGVVPAIGVGDGVDLGADRRCGLV